MKTISISQWVAAVAVMAVMSAFAAPVVNVGTLPVGKSVTIVFQTTINNSVPNGTTQISSSGTVSGDNFSSVNAGPAVTPLFIAPIITSATNTTFTVGISGVFNVTKTGAPIPDLFESGALPSNVSFNPGTGNLSGTPAVGTGGLYPLVFTATNAAGTNTQNFSLTVNQHPAFTNVSSTTFIAGSLGTFKIGASGFPAPTLSETNTDVLPGGVGFADNGNGTATLSGTPAGGSGGTYTLHFFATNGISTDAAQTFTLTVDQAPVITSVTNTLFTIGKAGSFTVTATGFPVPALSESGALPSGVTFVPATGILSGTPAVGTGGTNHLTLTATNLVGTNIQNFSLVVNTPPVAQPMTVHRTAGLTLLIALSDLATNWSDADGDAVTLSAINLATTNGVTLATNSAWILYTNGPNVNDQFSYSIADPRGATNIGYVNILIVPSVTGTNSITSVAVGNPTILAAYGIPGYSYAAQRATNLVTPVWVNIATNTAAANGMLSVTDNFNDLGSNQPPAAYYRLSWSP